ncbi:MAG TPA: hypothetical protein VH309_15100 [Elusimicrobiota bacterium]|nr:hypothetical protein [Elusimicrobiota bacterium]
MRGLLLTLLLLPGAAAAAPDGGSRGRCADGLSIKGVLADAAAGRFKGRESAVSEAIAPYFEYEAFIRKDPDVCAPLKVFEVKHLTYREEEHSGDLRCRMHYWEIAFAHAFITRAPGTRGVCVARFLNEGQVSLARIKEACGIILERRDDPDGLCDATAPLLQPRRDVVAIGRCKAYYRAYKGDGAACAKLPPNPEKRLRCEAYAAFARATAERDPRLCGDSSLCRALVSGADDARARLLQEAKDGVCAVEAGRAGSTGP